VSRFLIAGSLILGLLSACTGGKPPLSSTSHPARALASPTALPSEGQSQTAGLLPVSVRVVLPSTTMVSGTTMVGKVIVTNNTGHTTFIGGCLVPFQVELGNDKIKPDPAWPGCYGARKLPMGESTWLVAVDASYEQCGYAPYPRCIRDDVPPGLPPGDYRAMLYAHDDTVPIPPPISVRVTP
jgi:hypothetical protein